MKCNRDPQMNYFRFNYWGWRLIASLQNRGTVVGKSGKRMPSGSLLVPGAAFLPFWHSSWNNKHDLLPNIRKKHALKAKVTSAYAYHRLKGKRKKNLNLFFCRLEIITSKFLQIYFTFKFMLFSL